MTDSPEASLAEIRALVVTLPPWGGVGSRDIAGATSSFGLIDTLAAWVAAGQGHARPRLDRPRVAVFLGNWGGDGAAAQATLEDIRAGRARLNGLCRHHDAELRVYEMAVETPDGSAQALSAGEAATALAYGMMAVEDGIDLLCLAATGPGADRAAGALAEALAALPDGADPDGADKDPLLPLARYGGHALCALAGALVAARMARVPVVLDGFAALAAGAALVRLNDGALDHCVLAQQCDGGAARALQDRLGKEAVLDLGITAADGSAALFVLGLLRGAATDGGIAPD